MGQKQENKAHLVRAIGFYGVSIMIINGMIGAGIFALPAAVSLNAGVLSPWLFLIIGLVFIPVVLCFASLASYFDRSGGAVLYTTKAFGPLVGFNTGWLLFLSRIIAFGANTNVLVLYLSSLFPELGDGMARAIFIIAFCGFLTFINILGVKDGVRTVAGFTILKLTPLLVIVLLSLQYVGADTFLPANLPTIDDLGGTTLLIIYAFVGFEQVSLTAGETQNPRKNIPKAMVLTIVAIAFLYFFIVLTYISVLPNGGAKGQTLVDVGQFLAGSTGALIITLTAVFSIGGNLAVAMLTVPRINYALAEQGMLPGWFGQLHKEYNTPHNSIIFYGLLGTILAVTGSFVYLAIASTLARLISYILCIAALPRVRKMASPEVVENAFHLKGGHSIPIFALIVCFWLASQTKAESWLLIGFLALLGLGLYFIEARQQKRIIH